MSILNTRAYAESYSSLTTKESIEVLSLYNIRTTKSGFATSEDEAAKVDEIKNLMGEPEYGDETFMSYYCDGCMFNFNFDEETGELSYSIIDVEDRKFDNSYQCYGPIPKAEILKWSNLKQNKGWQ